MGIFPPRVHTTFEQALTCASMNNPDQEINFFLVEPNVQPVLVGRNSAWNYHRRHPEYTLITELATDFTLPEIQVHTSSCTY